MRARWRSRSSQAPLLALALALALVLSAPSSAHGESLADDSGTRNRDARLYQQVDHLGLSDPLPPNR